MVLQDLQYFLYGNVSVLSIVVLSIHFAKRFICHATPPGPAALPSDRDRPLGRSVGCTSSKSHVDWNEEDMNLEFEIC